VVHDHLGIMICSQALWFEHAASALSMEAIAILEGAKLAQEMGTYALSLRMTLCWLSTSVILTTKIG
jgi:hypothetical protein